MNKKILLLIVVLIVIVGVAIWLWKAGPSYAPTLPSGNGTPITPVIPDDTTSAVVEELDTLDLGDLDTEFQTIDQDLQGL